MRTFKKFLAVIVAFVMSFAVIIFAGFNCNDESTGGTQTPGGTETPGGTQTPGGSETPGGTQTPGGSETPGGNDSRLENIITEILTPIKSVQFDIALTGDTEADVTGKFNFDEGNADIVTAAGGYGKYTFVRNWSAFHYGEDGEVSDWTDKSLSYDGYVFGGVPVPELAAMLPVMYSMLPAANYPVLVFAEATESIVFAGDTATVDMNKLIYTELGWAEKLLSEIDNNTTVTELLENRYARNILEPLFGKVTRTQINALIEVVDLETLPEQYRPFAQALISLLKTVEPNADSTTYSYLIKIIKSEEFNELIAGFGFELPCEFAQLKLGVLLEMLMPSEPPLPDAGVSPNSAEGGYDISMLADAFKASFGETTAQKFVYKSYSDYADRDDGDNTVIYNIVGSTSMEEFKITYTFKGNRISAQTITGNYSEKTQAFKDDQPVEIPNVTGEHNISLDVNLAYGDTSHSLTDIDDVTVEESVWSFNGRHENLNLYSYGDDYDYELESELNYLMNSVRIENVGGEYVIYQDGSEEPADGVLTAYDGTTFYYQTKLGEEKFSAILYASKEDMAASRSIAIWSAPVKEGEEFSFQSMFMFDLYEMADYADIVYEDGEVKDISFIYREENSDALTCTYEDGKITISYNGAHGVTHYEYYLKVIFEKEFYNEEMGPDPWVCIFKTQEEAEHCNDYNEAYVCIRLEPLNSIVTGTVGGYAYGNNA